MNTDNNQNKQLTELSDEELKQVTGGTSSTETCRSKTSFGGKCPVGYIEKGDECCKLDNGQQLYYFRPSLTAPNELNDLGPIS